MTEESLLFSAGRTQGTQAVACEQRDCHGGTHLNSYILWGEKCYCSIGLPYLLLLHFSRSHQLLYSVGGKVVFESNVCLAIFAPFPPFHSYAALCEVSISIILLREKSSFRSSIGKPYFPLLLTPRSWSTHGQPWLPSLAELSVSFSDSPSSPLSRILQKSSTGENL